MRAFAGSVGVPETVRTVSAARGTVARVPVDEPPVHVQFAGVSGSSRTVTVVLVSDTTTMRPRSGVSMVRDAGFASVGLAPAGAAARSAWNSTGVDAWPAPSVTVTRRVTVPTAGTVTVTRSAVTVEPPTTSMRVTRGARPPWASTTKRDWSSTATAASATAATWRPAGLTKRAVTSGVPPRLTTSAEKAPVTPAWSPIPIHRSRTPAETARPLSPPGATKRRTSGRCRPCHSPATALAPAGRPGGSATSERSSSAVRKANPTVWPGPIRAWPGVMRTNE